MYGYSGRNNNSYSKKKKKKKKDKSYSNRYSSFGYVHITPSSIYGLAESSPDDIHQAACTVFGSTYYFLASDL